MIVVSYGVGGGTGCTEDYGSVPGAGGIADGSAGDPVPWSSG